MLLRQIEKAIEIEPHGFGAMDDNPDLNAVCNLVGGLPLFPGPPRNTVASHISREMARHLIELTGAHHLDSGVPYLELSYHLGRLAATCI